MTPVETRKKILLALYDFYKKAPHNFVDAAQLVSDLGIFGEDGQWNIHYLSQKGYIEDRKTLAGWQELKIKISHPGIDLIEDPSEFNREFPPVQI